MIFGHTRFSVFAPKRLRGGWRVNRQFSDSYKERLFDSERLMVKEKIFTELSIPLIRYNLELHPDYFHIIEYSDELPQYYKAKLQEIIDSHERIVGFQVTEKSSANAYGYEQIIIDIAKNNIDLISSKCVAVFNLDDDDLLSQNFVQKLKHYLTPTFVGFGVSFSKGLTAIYSPELEAYIPPVVSCVQPKINCGLASISEVILDNNSDVFISFSRVGRHSDCDTRMPVIHDAREVAYFWTRSKIQDTSTERKNRLEIVEKRLKSLPLATQAEMDLFFDIPL